MTLVACIDVKNKPVFIGDITVSGPTEDTNISWPTVQSIEQVFPQGSGFTPNGYIQKITLIGDDLVLAYSGTLIVARMVVKEIFEGIHKGLNPLMALVQAIEVNAKDVEEHLSIVACYLEKTGTNKCKYYPVHCFTSAPHYSTTFGKSIIAGQGTDILKRGIEGYSGFQVDRLKVASQSLDSINRGLALTSSLLLDEFTTNEPLENYFGGAYEICYMEEGVFKKLDRYMHAIWSVEIQADKDVKESDIFDVRLHTFSYNYYEKDIFVVARQRDVLRQASTNAAWITRLDYYAVWPIYRVATKTELESLTPKFVQPEYIAHIIEMHLPDGSIRKLHIFEANSENLIKIEWVDNSLQVIANFDGVRERVMMEFRR